VDPFGWGQALLAAAVATLASAVAPDLLVRASETVQRRITGGTWAVPEPDPMALP
jgi:cation-transporting P-type ATPase I